MTRQNSIDTRSLASLAELVTMLFLRLYLLILAAISDGTEISPCYNFPRVALLRCSRREAPHLALPLAHLPPTLTNCPLSSVQRPPSSPLFHLKLSQRPQSANHKPLSSASRPPTGPDPHDANGMSIFVGAASVFCPLLCPLCEQGES